MSVPPERRERLARMLVLRQEGLSYREIGVVYGLSLSQVYRVLGPADRAAVKRARPPWSHPDAELLAVARSIRREIEAAEGFRRPMV